MADGSDDKGRGWWPLPLYILVDRIPTPERDLNKWSRWMADFSNRRVAQYTAGQYFVSTVFLGLDHGFGRTAKPLIFESMVFLYDTRRHDSKHKNSWMWRYMSWYDAERNHKELCRKVNQIRSHVLPRSSLEEL